VTTRKQRPGRPKAGQTLLTRKRILAAALRLINEEGVDRFSMRRLATALGVDPMAIYHHLPNKEAILAGLVPVVFGQLQVPVVADAGWQGQVRAFAWAYRNLVRTHSNFVLHLVSNAELGANAALAANERLFAALARAGLPPAWIVRAADVLIDFLNGFALGERSGQLIGQPEERQPLLHLLEQHPADQFPVLRKVYASLDKAELAGDFEAELEIVLAGIEAIAQRGNTHES
jgi:TetR/AcrR family transcriptional regulator, tetracycline repressor protein